MKKPNILVYGYGNPGRQDDGLGNMFVEEIDKWIIDEKIENIDTDSNYQLNIEDADVISDKDIVVFVDASLEDIEDFTFTKVECSEAKIEFSMHAVSTSFVVDLCNKMYDKTPETYLLHLKGYEWDFEEKLTPKAIENMNLALTFLKKRILEPETLKTSV